MSSESQSPSEVEARDDDGFDADVLILGASFAGIEVLRRLARRSGESALRIIVVDRQARHPYIPLVQERLVGTIDPQTSVLDTQSYVRSLPGASFVHDEVVSLDPPTKQVRLASGRMMRARFIVVALGSRVDPPGDIEGSGRFVTHKFEADFSRAKRLLEARAQEVGDGLELVVVGGGISGVELACELATRPLSSAPRSRPKSVTLVGAGTRLLSGFPERVSKKCEHLVAKAGVKLQLGARVVRVLEDGAEIRTEDGVQRSLIPAQMVFWTGGLRPPEVLAQLGLARDEAGWLSVGPTLQCDPGPDPSHPDIFACGDVVRVYGGTGRWETMQRAIECLWQARIVAENILVLAREAPSYPDGLPSLRPHRPRSDFFYGISLGTRSLVVYGSLIVDLPGINHWFRRWLMRQYFRRYDAMSRQPRALGSAE